MWNKTSKSGSKEAEADARITKQAEETGTCTSGGVVIAARVLLASVLTQRGGASEPPIRWWEWLRAPVVAERKSRRAVTCDSLSKHDVAVWEALLEMESLELKAF